MDSTKIIKIGIDPDVDESGIAVIEIEKNVKNILMLSNLRFFQLLEVIRGYTETHPNVHVYIEAGYLNKISNYHGAANQSTAARIGKNVGSNHQVSKLLVEAMDFYGIPHTAIRPNKKSPKWASDFFQKVTGYKGRTNSEQRDAIKLIW